MSCWSDEGCVEGSQETGCGRLSGHESGDRSTGVVGLIPVYNPVILVCDSTG